MMLGNFFEKAITTTISLGMMIFSSYQGNTPSFSDIETFFYGNEITIQTNLQNAFNDDFRHILQSGQEVVINYTLTLENDYTSEIIYFTHKTNYDPLLDIWSLECEEKKVKTIKFDTWSEFVNANSEFLYKGDFYLTSPVEVELKAWLPTITLGQNNKSFDLMIFWNFHKPVSRTIIR